MVKDERVEQPASTRKHEAYAEKRRAEMENRRFKEEQKIREDYMRHIKQTRLARRVQCSPALVNNATALRSKRADSLAKNQRTMRHLEKAYDQVKAGIEFNVANRPLLVEQVSNAFIHNLNQIKELQRYVTILREAGMNPDNHLTDEQRELLVSADYYDRLNVATAYFPSDKTNAAGQVQVGDQMDGEIAEMGPEEEEGDASDQGEGQINDQEEVEQAEDDAEEYEDDQ